MLKEFDQFCPLWLHNITREQLTSPQLGWHYPGFGGKDHLDLTKASFALQPYNIARNYTNWQGVESLTFVLDWWINANKSWFEFKELNRCTINFYTAGQNTGWHNDHTESNFFTLLYYVNDSDGGTEFKDKKIPHKENSGVFFNSQTLHTPISSTVPRRISVGWVLDGSILN
jgi:hypothetical protein